MVVQNEITQHMVLLILHVHPRALLLEEDVERSEERLAKAVSELAKQSNR